MALNPTMQTTAGRPMTTYPLQDWMQMDVYKDTIMSSMSYAILEHKSMYCPTITEFLDLEFNFIPSSMQFWKKGVYLKVINGLLAPLHSSQVTVLDSPNAQ